MTTKLLSIFVLALILVAPIAYAQETLSAGGVGVKVSVTNYDPSPAKPGKYVTLFLEAENSGGESIDDAYFQLELEYPFSLKPGESATRHFSSLGSHEPVLLEYDLFVDTNALEGTYEVYLKLCDDASCDSYAKTSFDVTVKTGGDAKIEVGIEETDIFSAGTKGAVTLHAINRGLLDIKFLVIELKDSEPYEIVSPSRIYIGELESDDFETAEFEIYVNDDLPDESASIILPVLVEYSDANDKEYSEEVQVPLKVYSKSDLTKMQLVPQSSNNLGIVLLVLAGLFVAYMFYKKYKKNNGNGYS